MQLKNIGLSPEIRRRRENQRVDTLRRASFVSCLLRAGDSVLDIGSGFGFFLEEMKVLGFRPTGVEISAFARSAAMRVTAAKVLDTDILHPNSRGKTKEKFDAVTMFHVLEHVCRPVDFLKSALSYLKDKGLLIIEVPNRDDALLEVNSAYRAFYWQRAHILYFDIRTLRMVLRRANLSIASVHFVQRYGLENFMHWMVARAPQLDNPSFDTDGNYRWLESFYKRSLVEAKKSDTLVVVATGNSPR